MVFRSLLFNVAFYVNFLAQAVLFSPVLLLPERMFWPIGGWRPRCGSTE
jgi:hypothetical protein